MVDQRKIIASVAMSVDGYIARTDGNVDWLNRPRTAGDYGMSKFFKSIDTILWGRKTYETAHGFGTEGDGKASKIKNYVFSRQPPQNNDTQFEFVREPIKDFSDKLRQQPGKNIWMMGGAGIIASFLDAGELDEFIIHVIPTFIGAGIPLIEPRDRLDDLKLVSSHAYSDGVVELHYEVEKPVKKPVKKQKTEKLKGGKRRTRGE